MNKQENAREEKEIACSELFLIFKLIFLSMRAHHSEDYVSWLKL